MIRHLHLGGAPERRAGEELRRLLFRWHPGLAGADHSVWIVSGHRSTDASLLDRGVVVLAEFGLDLPLLQPVEGAPVRFRSLCLMLEVADAAASQISASGERWFVGRTPLRRVHDRADALHRELQAKLAGRGADDVPVPEGTVWLRGVTEADLPEPIRAYPTRESGWDDFLAWVVARGRLRPQAGEGESVYRAGPEGSIRAAAEVLGSGAQMLPDAVADPESLLTPPAPPATTETARSPESAATVVPASLPQPSPEADTGPGDGAAVGGAVRQRLPTSRRWRRAIVPVLLSAAALGWLGLRTVLRGSGGAEGDPRTGGDRGSLYTVPGEVAVDTVATEAALEGSGQVAGGLGTRVPGVGGAMAGIPVDTGPVPSISTRAASEPAPGPAAAAPSSRPLRSAPSPAPSPAPSAVAVRTSRSRRDSSSAPARVVRSAVPVPRRAPVGRSAAPDLATLLAHFQAGGNEPASACRARALRALEADLRYQRANGLAEETSTNERCEPGRVFVDYTPASGIRLVQRDAFERITYQNAYSP